ncbi:MAG: hypothetical protein RR729_03475 [Comamonas sp.]
MSMASASGHQQRLLLKRVRQARYRKAPVQDSWLGASASHWRWVI